MREAAITIVSVLAPACFVAAFASAAETATAPAEELHAGIAVEREIAGKQTAVYAVPLAAGDFAAITVEQRGIDVVVRIGDSDSKTLAEVDEVIKPVGQEQATIVAETAGTYHVTVTPRYPGAPAGRVAVTLTAVRPADEKDRQLFEAVRLATQGTSGKSTGKMEEARAAAARAVELGEKVLPPDAPYLASLILKFAYAERDVGHYETSLEIAERAEKIFEAALGRENPLTARALEVMGLAYFNLDDLIKAEALFRESQGIIERTLGPDHPRVMDCLLHMSVLHQELEDQHAAIADLERALPIGEKYLDPNDFQITAAINNIGTFYRELGDYDRAEPMLNRSLQRIEKNMGYEHPFVATPLQELGIIARERRDYDGALALLWRAEAAREKAYGFRASNTAATLLVIANVHDAMGDYENALRIRQIALQTLENSAGPYHHWTVTALSGMAETYTALRNVPCAIEYQTRMNQALDKSLELKLAIGSEREKLTYAQSTAERTERTISLHAVDAPADAAAAEMALLVILQRKGRVFDSMSKSYEVERQALKPEDQALWDRLRGTTAELAKVALSGPGKTAPAAYRAKLESLEDAKEDLEAKISAHSAHFRADYQPVTLAAVRDAIPRKAALIEFSIYRPFNARAASDAIAFGEPRYIAYVLRNQGRVLWKDLGSAKEIDAAIATWREALRDPQQSGVDALARNLDRAVMQPVRELIGNASHLLISPEGQLGLVPFEALVDSRGRYLVERYSISYLTSGRDLLGMRLSRPSKSPAVIIADPLFGEPLLASAEPAVKMASNLPRRSITSGEDFSTVYFGPLAGTREEARSIHALYPNSRVFTGSEATKSALLHVDAPRILHVATHGFFLDFTPHAAPAGTRSVSARVTTPNPLLRSGLALSGANLAGSGRDDGVLTALEASTLNLWGTKLVTLSACDSGVGEAKNHEGVYGLRRAFFLAGAETVVMSLWPISDYVTRQMMTAYYTGLKHGLGRGESLRQAELAMLKQPKRKHPFYWASFIQSGDWTPLR